MNTELDAEIDTETQAPAPPWPHDFSPPPSTTPDFSRRDFALRELMDEPCTYATYRAAALSLARLNRWTRGYKPTLDFLTRVLQHTGVTHEPLHIVDAACGHGDTLRHISRWAAKRSIPLRLTGIDINPYAARLARERDRQEHIAPATITWLTADIFTTTLTTTLARPADILLSSLFAHHLSDEAIPKLLHWNQTTARTAWLISDLRRSQRAANTFAWLTKLLPLHHMVTHDAQISFRRALSLQEWQAHCLQTNITAQIKDTGTGRLTVERINHSTPSS